jgi:hypothetical protein
MSWVENLKPGTRSPKCSPSRGSVLHFIAPVPEAFFAPLAVPFGFLIYPGDESEAGDQKIAPAQKLRTTHLPRCGNGPLDPSGEMMEGIGGASVFFPLQVAFDGR